jgi:hypothetical protein
MKTVVLSAGPIPAKLDSVKVITNKFKGGLAVKTAETLSLHKDIQVTIVKWRETEIRFQHAESHSRITVTDVDDIYDYRACILNTPADAYVRILGRENFLAITIAWVRSSISDSRLRLGSLTR